MNKLVIIIPGNPYSKKLYRRWLDSLNIIFEHEIELLSPPILDINDKSLDLYCENYEEKFLNNLRNKHPNHKVTIIAHSIGCYFTQFLCGKHSDKIEKVVYIFPYFGDENKAGRRLLSTMETIKASKTLTNLFIKAKPLLEVFEPDLSTLSKEEALNALSLASLESIYFKNKNSDKIKIDANIDSHFLYCDKDNWCTEKTVKNLSRFIRPIKVNTRHDFVLCEHEISLINKKLKSII